MKIPIIYDRQSKTLESQRSESINNVEAYDASNNYRMLLLEHCHLLLFPPHLDPITLLVHSQTSSDVSKQLHGNCTVRFIS